MKSVDAFSNVRQQHSQKQTISRRTFSYFLAVSPKRGTAIVMANPEKNVYHDNALRTLTDFDE